MAMVIEGRAGCPSPKHGSRHAKRRYKCTCEDSRRDELGAQRRYNVRRWANRFEYPPRPQRCPRIEECVQLADKVMVRRILGLDVGPTDKAERADRWMAVLVLFDKQGGRMPRDGRNDHNAGLSAQEIADKVGVTARQVQRILRRIRQIREAKNADAE